jgi:hypothetical protein
MTVNDGFGDDPVQQELAMEEYIREREGLVRLKVADRLRGASNATDVYADLCNEARITEWQVKTKRPDAPPEYVSASMSMRIRECLSRGTWTGLETHRGKQQDPLRRPMHERHSTDDETLTFDEVVSSGAWLDEVLVRYHDGEIAQVINELPRDQREYAFLRFWGGWSNKEIARFQERKYEIVERQWRDNIKPHLARRLAHLVDI